MGFWGDERGQPVQIGFILLFGILVLAFAGYQGYVVPNQNSQVEFQHSQESSNEMQTFREDFLRAAEDGRRFSAGFTLGTDYPARLVALNPPPASGKLRTEAPGDGRFYLDAGEHSLAEICGIEQGGDGGVPSNALVYQPSYSEYQDRPKVVYENTVTYNRFSRNDVVRFTSEQTIIQGKEILIPPLVGDVSADGTERHTIDLYPGRTGVGKASGSDVTLTIPTDLTTDQWRKLLEDEMGDGGRVKTVKPNGSDVVVVLESGSYDITCPVIGTGDKPDNNPHRLRGSDEGINPAAPGDVSLEGQTRPSNSEPEITLHFNNTGGAKNITRGRINYYQYTGSQDGKKKPISANLSDETGSVSATLQIQGNFRAFDPSIELAAQDTTDVNLEFLSDSSNKASLGNDDWFVLTLQYDTGEQGMYFISAPSK